MVIPMAPRTPQYRVPSIAEGMGEKPKATKPPVLQRPARQATGGDRKAAAPAPKSAPKVQAASVCPSEEQRLRNYAGRMVEGFGLNPTDDLKLFSADGTPQPNLTPVMLAMAAFELGALRASPALVEGAHCACGRRAEENTKRRPAMVLRRAWSASASCGPSGPRSTMRQPRRSIGFDPKSGIHFWVRCSTPPCTLGGKAPPTSLA